MNVTLFKLFFLSLLLSVSFFNETIAKSFFFDDCERYVRQGDSLFKIGNYSAAIRKYKSCLIIKDGNDEYTKNKIQVTEDILNLKANAGTLIKLGKKIEAVDRYKKILVLNPEDTEAEKEVTTFFEQEAESFLKDGDDNNAYEAINEAIIYAKSEKKNRLGAKLKSIDSHRKNAEYIRIKDAARSLFIVGKFADAKKKYTEVFSLPTYSKDLTTKKLIAEIESFETLRTKAGRSIVDGNYFEAVNNLEKIYKAGVVDPIISNNLLIAYQKQAESLVNENKYDEAIALLNRATELFKDDKRKVSVLQKKLKSIASKKKK